MTPYDSRHPEAERLAEYAEGTLDAAARSAVEAHLADCADCRAVVMETVAFLDAEPAAAAAPAAEVIPFRPRSWMTGVAAGLAVAAALAMAILIDRPGRSAGERGGAPQLDELVAALATEPTRPVAGRLSGGFRYAAPPVAVRGTDDRPLSPDTRIAVARIEKQASGRRDASAREALGTAALIAGDCARAITILGAGDSAPLSSTAINNLAVAYISCAQERRGGDDLLPKAIAAADRVIAQSPRSPEGYFNRALALELSGASDDAAAAWRQYQQVDATSEWAKEAQRHLDSSSR